MKTIALFFLLLFTVISYSQNPLVPPGIYMADPAARLWDDGRLYLYCSVDESTEWYCSRNYHVLSTDDMVHWKLHENTFASIGKNDQVPYNDNLLFAPDCMFRNGMYYLYYCQPDRDAEGVAVSASPSGPFKNGKPMDTGKFRQIDPGVFIDDDGQAYYVWGQSTMKMAKLGADMYSLEEGSIRDSVLTEGAHFFHEGASMTKRNGIYYLVYADMSRGQTPTCIGYATSKYPMGPYTYGGVIIDNDHSDPQCWNNHGSIAEFKGQWYVFYHRATHNSRMMRRACVEPISFKADGSIPEVEMTSQGAGPALDAYAGIDAASSCWMFGNVRIEEPEKGLLALTDTKNGDRAAFKYIDFGEGAGEVQLRVRPGNRQGVIQLKLDYPWTGNIAQADIPAASKEEWITLTAKVTGASGIHALWLVFYGDQESGEFGCSLESLFFK